MLYTPVTSEGGSSSDAATYAAYIDFEADDSIRLGMTATVRSIDEAEDETEVEGEVEEAEEAAR